MHFFFQIYQAKPIPIPNKVRARKRDYDEIFVVAKNIVGFIIIMYWWRHFSAPTKSGNLLFSFVRLQRVKKLLSGSTKSKKKHHSAMTNISITINSKLSTLWRTPLCVYAKPNHVVDYLVLSILLLGISAKIFSLVKHYFSFHSKMRKGKKKT